MAANHFSKSNPFCYAGPETNDPLAYRYYDAKRLARQDHGRAPAYFRRPLAHLLLRRCRHVRRRHLGSSVAQRAPTRSPWPSTNSKKR